MQRGEHSEAQIQRCDGWQRIDCGGGGLIDQRGVLRSLSEHEQASAGVAVLIAVAYACSDILGDGLCVVVFGLVNGAGFIPKERRVAELVAGGANLCERVVKLEVVPEYGCGLHVAIWRAWMNGAHPPPEGRGLGKLLRGVEIEIGGAAVRVDIADGGKAVKVCGIRGREALLNRDGAAGLCRIEVGKRSVDPDGLIAEYSVGGIGFGEPAKQWRALLKVRPPDIDLG